MLAITLFIGIRYNITIVSGVADAITYPFKKGIHYISEGWQQVTGYFGNAQALVEENERLQQENDRLVYQNTILEQYKGENDQLKALLSMKQRYQDYPSLGANVIAKDSGNWYKIFNVDKGQLKGIDRKSVV